MRDKSRDDTMKLRTFAAAALAITLAGCTTIPTAADPISSRWVGQSAGKFFAAFGPPQTDADNGGGNVYTWQGGYKTVTIPAKYADGTEGKRGKQISPARKQYLRCKAVITTSSDYTIRSIKVSGDLPGLNGGPSYCAEFLAPAQPAAQ
jgi:hypothetical protein